MNGCSNLGAAYQSGIGRLENLDEANRLYGQACEGGFMQACANLGYNHRHGLGVPADTTAARSFYAKACEGGHAGSCEARDELE